jgi:hypothetical protein
MRKSVVVTNRNKREAQFACSGVAELEQMTILGEEKGVVVNEVS